MTNEEVATIPDRLRAAAVAGSAAAMIAVPLLGPRLFGTREEIADQDTVATPPDYAFVVWAPVFAGIAANAVRQVSAPGTDVSRSTGSRTASAYALNAAWSVASQSGRLRLTPFLLAAAASAADAASRRAPSPADGVVDEIALASTDALAGWTSLAAAINALAGAQLAGLDPQGPAARRAAVAALLGVGGLTAGRVGSSRRPAARALTVSWGLVTLAADRRRPRPVRAAATSAAAAVVAAWWWPRSRSARDTTSTS